jgi:hypothetical protein
MKTFITAATVVALLSVPAFAEGDDASTKAGEAKGNLKATTEQKQEPLGSNAMGQGVAAPRATSGASSRTDQLNKEETSSPANPGRKTGVTGGGDDSGGSNSGAGGGSGGSGGGSGGGGGGGGSR